MKKHQKKALISLLCGLGLIVILVGLFTPLYPFMYGVVAAIAVWIIAGASAQYMGIEKR